LRKEKKEEVKMKRTWKDRFKKGYKDLEEASKDVPLHLKERTGKARMKLGT